jgi:predicted nucleic acid-binding protein
VGEVDRGLLDTSVVIAREEAENGLSLPPEVAISVATLAELHYGVLVAKDDKIRHHRLQRLGVIESTFQTLPIDAAVARAFAAVAQAVKVAGRQPRSRVMDLWIAATALTHRIPLYTRNPADFQGLEALIEVRIA